MKNIPIENHNYWIFDIHGTLTLAAHDFDNIRNQLGIEQGKPILEAIAQMPADKADAVSKQLHELELGIAARSQPQPHAKELLNALQKRGARLGIVTRNAKDIARVTLQAAGLSEYFEDLFVIGREQCEPKPDPAGILWLMEQWHTDASSTLMVGDYVFDLQAGRHAGVTTVHFDTNAEFAWPEYTDLKIQHLRQLLH